MRRTLFAAQAAEKWQSDFLRSIARRRALASCEIIDLSATGNAVFEALTPIMTGFQRFLAAAAVKTLRTLSSWKAFGQAARAMGTSARQENLTWMQATAGRKSGWRENFAAWRMRRRKLQTASGFSLIWAILRLQALPVL